MFKAVTAVQGALHFSESGVCFVLQAFSCVPSVPFSTAHIHVHSGFMHHNTHKCSDTHTNTLRLVRMQLRLPGLALLHSWV